MTRKEASFILANIDRRVCDDELIDALDTAIKALEQEPMLDKIRAEIADAKENAEITFGHPLGFDRIATYDKCLQIIDKYRQEG